MSVKEDNKKLVEIKIEIMKLLYERDVINDELIKDLQQDHLSFEKRLQLHNYDNDTLKKIKEQKEKRLAIIVKNLD